MKHGVKGIQSPLLDALINVLLLGLGHIIPVPIILLGFQVPNIYPTYALTDLTFFDGFGW